ncbi:hypothetical protein CLOM_g21055 [Closterium sp. NIES-68]|nr:hypothetical protein CLOM_g21055 [Closterium sp. NIES-68]
MPSPQLLAVKPADAKYMHPELRQVEEVSGELGCAADHWAGDHSRCQRPGTTPPRCISKGWGEESAIYAKGSAAHKAVSAWFEKRLGPAQVAPFIRGANSSLNESFHSLVCKYAPKRLRFRGSMVARVALAVLHWNSCVDRLVNGYCIRVRRATRVQRGSAVRILGPMDWSWVEEIMQQWLRAAASGDSTPMRDLTLHFNPGCIDSLGCGSGIAEVR